MSKSRKKDKNVKVGFRNDSPYQTSAHFLDIQKHNSSGGKSSENTTKKVPESETPQFKMSVVSSRKGSTSPVHKLYQIPTGLCKPVRKKSAVRKLSKEDIERKKRIQAFERIAAAQI